MLDTILVGVELGVAEGEADTQAPGLVEQRLGVPVGHLPVVVVIELGGVLHEPPREEGGHGQLRIDQQVHSLVRGFVEERHEAIDNLVLRLVAGYRAHLTCSDRDPSWHPCSSVWLTHFTVCKLG